MTRRAAVHARLSDANPIVPTDKRMELGRKFKARVEHSMIDAARKGLQPRGKNIFPVQNSQLGVPAAALGFSFTVGHLKDRLPHLSRCARLKDSNTKNDGSF